MNSEFFNDFMYYGQRLVFPSFGVTLRMVFSTMVIGTLLGFVIAVLLTIYGPNGLNHKKHFYKSLNFLVNMIRSFPILILIVALSPATRAIIGTTIGEKAVVLPLSIAATALISKMLESHFINVDKQLIEAARSFGATNLQIIFKVILKETAPSIVSVLTIATVSYISATTIAGAVGGGGLGAIALTYGYQSFNNMVLYTAVVLLVLLVNIVQFFGDWLYKKMY